LFFFFVGVIFDSFSQSIISILRKFKSLYLSLYCQTQIGMLIGDIDYVSVHHLRRRFRDKMKMETNSQNSQVKELYEKAEVKLKNIMQHAKI